MAVPSSPASPFGASDLYPVLCSMLPLYAAMAAAYASVRRWRVFTAPQCAGINRFVAVFAVPMLSFRFISANDPYAMDYAFLLADTLSKAAVLVALVGWTKLRRCGGGSDDSRLDWLITLFALCTLPNTLVMGIPLLTSMYGPTYGCLMVQLVVLQCIVWYTLLLFLFEYRAALRLIRRQFPPGLAPSIVSFDVDPDVLSLDDGGSAAHSPLLTQAEVGGDGKVRVTVRHSSSVAAPPPLSAAPNSSSAIPFCTSCAAAAAAASALFSVTPRLSNLTSAEVYSVHSSLSGTPRRHRHRHHLHSSAADILIYSDTSSHASTPPISLPMADMRAVHPVATCTDHTGGDQNHRCAVAAARHDNDQTPACAATEKQMCAVCGNNPSAGMNDRSGARAADSGVQRGGGNGDGSWCAVEAGDSEIGGGEGGEELHMFVWSGTGSPASEVSRMGKGGAPEESQSNNNNRGGAASGVEHCCIRAALQAAGREPAVTWHHSKSADQIQANHALHGISVFNKAIHAEDVGTAPTPPFNKELCSKHSSSVTSKLGSSSSRQLNDMPPTTVMAKLILQMACRKLLRNPNTYSSLLGVIWSLISFRWNIVMPKIIDNSIKILADAGLGMAMFSLGLFMALQPKLIPCNSYVAIFALVTRFLVGPFVMAVSSIAIGLRGVNLHAAIVQASLPQGIVPFVFAKEYNLHPDILSTAVIFGMLVALPTTLLYYVLLGLG